MKPGKVLSNRLLQIERFAHALRYEQPTVILEIQELAKADEQLQGVITHLLTLDEEFRAVKTPKRAV